MTSALVSFQCEQERKRAEVLEEQQRRLQDAAVGPNVPDDDSLELTGPERALALKVMGGIEEGDAILGIGSEVNLESQVPFLKLVNLLASPVTALIESLQRQILTCTLRFCFRQVQQM